MASTMSENSEAPSKPRTKTFTSVTTAGNTCVAELQKVVNQGSEKVLEEIKKVVPKLLHTAIDVTFERAKVWSALDSDETREFFRNLDYVGWLTPGNLNQSELEKVKIDSGMGALLDYSKKMLSELDKCKKEIRGLSKTVTRPASCVENDSFRKRVVGTVEFLHVNIGKLQSLLQGSLDKCPMDIGTMTFYQFITSNRGGALMDILMLGGQPNPVEWEKYDQWWIKTQNDWIEQEKLGPNAPDWPTRIMWKAKSFMNEYWLLTNKLSLNPFVLSVEEILWSFQLFKQVLLDLKLVSVEDLKINKTSRTFLQNMADMPKLLLETDGDWAKVQKLLKQFFPITAKAWIFSNIRKQDWVVLQTEKLPALISDVDLDSLAVPKFRNLPEFYRAKLIPAKKQLGDKVAKKIKKKVRRQPPPSDEDSESEQEPPKKKKKRPVKVVSETESDSNVQSDEDEEEEEEELVSQVNTEDEASEAPSA